MSDVLELLVQERDRLDQAIAVLRGTRRPGRPPGRRGPGRPPGSGKKAAGKKVRRRRAVSAEARKRMSEAQKKRSASQKKATKKPA